MCSANHHEVGGVRSGISDLHGGLEKSPDCYFLDADFPFQQFFTKMTLDMENDLKSLIFIIFMKNALFDQERSDKNPSNPLPRRRCLVMWGFESQHALSRWVFSASEVAQEKAGSEGGRQKRLQQETTDQ